MPETESPETRPLFSHGEIGLNIRTQANNKLGQGQVSGRVSVLC